MKVLNVNSNPKNNVAFSAVPDRKIFRGTANTIIAHARGAHQMEYLEPFNGKSGPTLQEVLKKAIFEDAKKIGRGFIEKTDRGLFRNLTHYYANFEEAETGIRPVHIDDLTLEAIQAE